jgi:carbonic anhydrase
MASDSTFDDVLSSNAAFAEGGGLDLTARAGRGLAVVTCMDARIDPLAVLGLAVGDALVLRTAGGRVTDEVLRSLVLGRHVLGCERVLVMQHTECKVAGATEDEIHAAIAAAGGPDTRSLPFLTTTDQQAAIRADVNRLLSSPYLTETAVAGALYDLRTGRVERVC